MHASQLLRLLAQLQDDLGCVSVALRCDCKNLETVYVIERCGELAVTDRGETFKYLGASGDDAYEQIDLERAKAICDKHRVLLDDRDPEQYPEVIHVLGEQPLQAAIDAVAGAVDELFSDALGRRSRWSD